MRPQASIGVDRELASTHRTEREPSRASESNLVAYALRAFASGLRLGCSTRSLPDRRRRLPLLVRLHQASTNTGEQFLSSPQVSAVHGLLDGAALCIGRPTALLSHTLILLRIDVRRRGVAAARSPGCRCGDLGARLLVVRKRGEKTHASSGRRRAGLHLTHGLLCSVPLADGTVTVGGQ